jgi:N-methylhydantoinase B
LATVNAGDVLRVRLAGAGGYGEPGERERERVLDDLAEGKITPEHALAAYGVDVERPVG